MLCPLFEGTHLYLLQVRPLFTGLTHSIHIVVCTVIINKGTVYSLWCGVYNLPKYFTRIGTQITSKEHEKLTKICELEDKTEYAIVKELVTGLINNYPFERGKASQKRPQQTLDVGDGLNEPSRGRAAHKS